MAQTHLVSIVNSKGTATDDATAANVSVAGVTDGNLSHISEDFIAQQGVVDLSSDCKVTAQGTPDMTVNAAAGTAYIQSSTWTQNSNTLRYYRDVCTIGASGSELTIGANASGSTRIDQVCTKIDTTVTGGGTVDNTGSNVASYLVVVGTPGAGIPATPSDHLAVANITVANGASSITSGEISDVRQKAYMVDWQPINDSASYSSATTYSNTNTTYAGVITVGSGGIQRYPIGQKITFKQPTDGRKYGVITKTTDTTITVFLGTDYDLDSEAITDVMISSAKSPEGFPMAKSKWKQETNAASLVSLATPGAATWVNIGSLSIDVAAGNWEGEYFSSVYGNDSSGTSNKEVFATLSKANNTEDDVDWTSPGRSNALEDGGFPLTRRKEIEISSDDTYYLNEKSTVNVAFLIINAGTIIRLYCAYI